MNYLSTGVSKLWTTIQALSNPKGHDDRVEIQCDGHPEEGRELFQPATHRILRQTCTDRHSQWRHQRLHRLSLIEWHTWSQSPTHCGRINRVATRIQSDPCAPQLWVLCHIKLSLIQNRSMTYQIYVQHTQSPHDTNIACPTNPTHLTPFSLWSEPVETARFLDLPLDDFDDNQPEPYHPNNRYNNNNNRTTYSTLELKTILVSPKVLSKWTHNEFAKTVYTILYCLNNFDK